MDDDIAADLHFGPNDDNLGVQTPMQNDEDKRCRHQLSFEQGAMACAILRKNNEEPK